VNTKRNEQNVVTLVSRLPAALVVVLSSEAVLYVADMKSFDRRQMRFPTRSDVGDFSSRPTSANRPNQKDAATGRSVFSARTAKLTTRRGRMAIFRLVWVAFREHFRWRHYFRHSRWKPITRATLDDPNTARWNTSNATHTLCMPTAGVRRQTTAAAGGGSYRAPPSDWQPTGLKRKHSSPLLVHISLQVPRGFMHL